MLGRIVGAAAILFTAAVAQAADTAPDEANKRLIEARAVEAVIWGMPAVNYDLMLQEFKRIGGKENQIVYWSRPLDGNNQTLWVTHRRFRKMSGVNSGLYPWHHSVTA